MACFFFVIAIGQAIRAGSSKRPQISSDTNAACNSNTRMSHLGYHDDRHEQCKRVTPFTRVTKSYLSALGTTQISSYIPKHWTKFPTHQTGNYPVTCFVSKPSGITSVVWIDPYYRGNSRRFWNETCHGVIPCLYYRRNSRRFWNETCHGVIPCLMS